MLRISTCIFLFVALHGSRAQTNQDLCAGCVMVNGAGYNNHVDCDKFIQCHVDANGVLVGEIMSCPFSTYWNMNYLTCSPVSETQCQNDKCSAQPDNTVYGDEHNCRGYWQCLNGQSKPMCCSHNQRYSEAMGCVDDVDDKCKDTCFGVRERFVVPEVCDKYGVAGKPDKYQQQIAGWGMRELPCAPGTLFVEDSCACLQFTNQNVQKPTCTAEIHLPFTKDHRDESGKGLSVTNENVEVRNGVAVFNGVNSRLIIPRFTNLEHSTTVVIKAKYSSKHETWTGMARALVANSDCGNLPSIMISEDSHNQYFGVGTNEAKFAYAFVPHRDVDPALPRSEKEVEYRFDNGELSGSNGADTDTVAAPGYLRNVRCAIQIGHADNLQPFEGEIDELTIYLCNPDKP